MPRISSKGLVELWLKDVETTMLESIHEQMKLAWDNYYKVTRIKWVLGWPGQVVLSISCMAWTYEVGIVAVARKLLIHLIEMYRSFFRLSMQSKPMTWVITLRNVMDK